MAVRRISRFWIQSKDLFFDDSLKFLTTCQIDAEYNKRGSGEYGVYST